MNYFHKFYRHILPNAKFKSFLNIYVIQYLFSPLYEYKLTKSITLHTNKRYIYKIMTLNTIFF